MTKTVWKIVRVGLLLGGSLPWLMSGVSVADDDEHEERRGKTEKSQGQLDVAPVTHEKYKQECGSCHFPYQPGLLPSRSWHALLANLDDHFGENAELSAAVLKELGDYLDKNAAEHASEKRAIGINRSLSAQETPLRLTTTTYFKRKHHEITAKMVQDNPQVKSFSHCETCHTQAAQGSYNEHEVTIPGFGPWKD